MNRTTLAQRDVWNRAATSRVLLDGYGACTNRREVIAWLMQEYHIGKASATTAATHAILRQRAILYAQ